MKRIFNDPMTHIDDVCQSIKMLINLNCIKDKQPIFLMLSKGSSSDQKAYNIRLQFEKYHRIVDDSLTEYNIELPFLLVDRYNQENDEYAQSVYSELIGNDSKLIRYLNEWIDTFAWNKMITGIWISDTTKITNLDHSQIDDDETLAYMEV